MENYGLYFPLRLFSILIFRFIVIGLFELESGTILFAWPLRKDGLYREEEDIVEAWSLNGYVELVISLMVLF